MSTTQESTATQPGAHVALGIFSSVVLAYEIFLTKLLSYALIVTLLYVVLGVALLGFGAAGTLVAMRPRWLAPDAAPRALAWAAIAFVATLILATAAFLGLTRPIGLHAELAFLVSSLLSAPFLAAGVVVAIALSVSEGRVGRAYAANLVGSGIGCFLPIALLGPLNGPSFMALLCVLALGAAWVYARRARMTRELRAGLLVAALLTLLAVAFRQDVFHVHPEPAPTGQLDMVRGMAALRQVEMRSVFDRWNTVGRIEIFSFDDAPGSKDVYPVMLFQQDASAFSTLTRWDGKTKSEVRPNVQDGGSLVAQLCSDAIYAQGYFRHRARVLAIGLGGGPDLQCALYQEAEHVDAVDINPDVVTALTGPLSEWVGGIGQDPRIDFHVQDGRSFVHGVRDGRYDLIQLTGTDTKHAHAAGAMALTENLLYTEEAFVDYLQSLSSDGVLSVVRYREAEAIRLANTAVAALQVHGVEHPERHIAFVSSDPMMGMLVRRTPFPPEEISALKAQYAFSDRPFRGHSVFFVPWNTQPSIVYAPGEPSAHALGAFFKAVVEGSRADFEEQYPLQVSPPTDDHPFFFDHSRYDREPFLSQPHMKVLVSTLGSLALLSLLLILVPTWRLRAGLGLGQQALSVLFFGGVGLGYLLLEVWMLHLFAMFLGNQTYSLSVVLAILLISTGLGALFGERFVPQSALRVWLGVAVIALAVGLGLSAFPLLLEAAWSLPLMGRAAVVVLFVAPTGLAMGLPFPAGLRWAHHALPDSVPWCVGVNGFASVLATVAVIPIALLHGYAATAFAGLLCYALAAAAAARFGRVAQ
ncbi:MAG: hypothetical protein OXU20_13070 [Myxococcales bacterium]|nr:hypothetical protein [Myxococcales bacterium]